jgi:polyisoprenyl-phosphate glycosyltransferase
MRHERPILVTGCSGFVGANLAAYFLDQGRRVVGIEGPSLNEWRTRSIQGLELIRVDLRRETDVRRLVETVDPIAILNCAAYGAYPSQTDVARMYEVNFNAVRWMLEAVRGRSHFRAFVQAGTSSEYGLNCTAPSEDAVVLPDSDYAVSKVGATALIRYNGHKHAVPAWALRLYSVYGPYEDFSRLIPQLLLKARHGHLPPLVNPMISRDFVYVDDVARAFSRVLEQADRLPRGEIYNIGTGCRTTLEDLVALTRTIFDISAAPSWGSMAERHWDHPEWYANPAKAKRDLGWEAPTGLDLGLKATMRWMEENPDVVNDALRHTVAEVPA